MRLLYINNSVVFNAKLSSDHIDIINSYIRANANNLLLNKAFFLIIDEKFFEVRLYKYYKYGIVILKNVNDWIYQIRTLHNELRECKAQNDRFFQIVNKAPYLIWLRDKNLNIVSFNMKYSNLIEQRILNYGNKNENLLELSDQTRKISFDSNNISLSNQIQIIGVNVQNKIQNIQTQEKVIANGDYIVGYGHDIEHVSLKKNDINNRQSDIYRTLLEYLSSAIVIYNAKQQLVFFNRSFLKVWKVNNEFLETKPTYSEMLDHLRENNMLPEQIDFQDFKRKELQLFTNLTEIHNDFYYLPNRQVIHITVIPHTNGELLFVYDDVTDRITLEENYNTSVKTHYTTLNHLNEGICVYGFDGKLKLYNNSFVKMWLIPQHYLDRKPHVTKVMNYLYGDDNAKKLNAQNIIENVINNVEYSEIIENNKQFFNVRVIPLPDSSSLVKYKDITAQKIIESTLKSENENLQQMANIKSKFFASVSYEIKTPITSIQGFSEMILNGMCGKVTNIQRNYVQNIYNEISMLDNMVNNILYMNSIEAGVYHIDYVSYNLDYIINLTQKLIAKEFAIPIELTCENKNHNIKLDIKLYQQLIKNILVYIKRNVCIKIESIAINNNDNNINYINEIIFYLDRNIDHNINIENNIHIMIVEKLAKMQNFSLKLKRQERCIVFQVMLNK